MNTNFKVIDLTRLVIKPESTAPEADARTTRPFELFVGFGNTEQSEAQNNQLEVLTITTLN